MPAFYAMFFDLLVRVVEIKFHSAEAYSIVGCFSPQTKQRTPEGWISPGQLPWPEMTKLFARAVCICRFSSISSFSVRVIVGNGILFNRLRTAPDRHHTNSTDDLSSDSSFVFGRFSRSWRLQCRMRVLLQPETAYASNPIVLSHKLVLDINKKWKWRSNGGSFTHRFKSLGNEHWAIEVLPDKNGRPQGTVYR